MDMLWTPPAQNPAECDHLQQNFLNCLKEKVVKDDVPVMSCKVEEILWFNVECPDRYKDYKDPIRLRSIFMNVKKGKGLDRPEYVKL